MRFRLLLVVFALVLLSGCGKEEGESPTSAQVSYFSVLVEDFTNVNCIPCADVHDALGSVVDAFAQEGLAPVLVEFHPMIYPDDPFHDAAAEVHDSRMSFYGIDGVPQLFIDGVQLPQERLSDPDYLWWFVDSVRALEKPLSISISASAVGESVDVSVTVSSGVDSTVSTVLYCVLVRDTVTFDDAPGSNGITEFHDVAAVMLPDVGGSFCALPPGGETSFHYSAQLPDEVPGGATSGYSVVAFVQGDDRVVLGAARGKVE